ncbi:HAD-IA family hydrolase [Salinibius halmophilus]|uniref:HAD-IA family hydrolase n=1 Tax=Salinibius halmophilus TaxID=1853216 RepID=UPI000E67577C|nr:HAD-IA family hydrolase [Salinibius halmophilus]
MIKAVLFDLGRVLVRLNGYPFQPDWVADPEASMQVFMAEPCLHAYHCGQVSESGFINTMHSVLGLAVSHEAFMQHFRHWPDQLLPNALEIVAKVNPQAKKAVFSNINDSHWAPTMQLGLAGKFDYYFASHRIGHAKPDAAMYTRALRDMGCKASEVLLVDDTLANINTAKQLGLHAEQVVGTEALTQVLKDYQLL